MENIEERKQRGKAPKGCINLEIEQLDDKLTFKYKDDGGGLNLEKIKDIGVTKGMISKEESEPHKIANLIFTPGFSTAGSISEISGRGVGLDAVMKFVESSGGTLSMNLDLNASGLTFAPVEFCISLPMIFFRDKLESIEELAS